ncbi:hypothetical protein CFP65_5000 [Kitasatospora sp. MMS16-BH015]|uniref:serine hydrolase domain-containing protein n=1 Tax=Kitasatospora sp. MMS16-BH015 TaxID=2018025 RepID=UPI000CA155F9|nr:serine hydrolase domain-containing protein [Kitasatospora sp. MMS16-BH015]AUG79713.1 hypothetical protein CFP65_5000 [Kitasatospora sp. MMS16-BH015]
MRTRPRTRRWPAALLAATVALSTPAATAFAAPRTPVTQRQLTADLTAVMQRLRIPGAVVSVTTPEWGTWTTSLGTSDLATGRPMDPADHVRIGSITKTLTGTVILELVKDGLLGLDDPVSTYRPDVPDGEHITIRQLLQMTSGLYNYSEDPEFNRQLDDHPERDWTPQQLLDIAFAHDCYFPPGTGFHYSNTNTILLGLIAEQLTHRSLGELIRKGVFEPVGMTESSFDPNTALPGPYAHGYEFISNVASLTTPTLTGKDAAWADWSAGNPYEVTHNNVSWAAAAGGVVSTVADLNRWAPVLAKGDLLTPELQRQRLDFIHTSDQPNAPGYGLAIFDVDGFIGHDGQLPGYTSFMAYDPDRAATIVVLANLNQSPDGTAPANELTKLIVSELFPH